MAAQNGSEIEGRHRQKRGLAARRDHDSMPGVAAEKSFAAYPPQVDSRVACAILKFWAQEARRHSGLSSRQGTPRIERADPGERRISPT